MNIFPALFGETPSSPRLASYLDTVASSTGVKVPEAEVKAYSDAVYYNYPSLGLSLLFTPSTDSKPLMNVAAEYENILLDSIDIFNLVKSGVPSKGRTYSRFPLLPLELAITPTTDPTSSQDHFILKAEMTGKEILHVLGEPTRKGGGAGPSAGSINIWCDWQKHGIMVEFGGDEARGPQAWDRGKDAVWKVVTLSKRKNT